MKETGAKPIQTIVPLTHVKMEELALTELTLTHATAHYITTVQTAKKITW